MGSLKKETGGGAATVWFVHIFHVALMQLTPFALPEPKTIKVTLPDGKVVEGIAGKTTALDIAGGISKQLRDETVVAKVRGFHIYITVPQLFFLTPFSFLGERKAL